MHIATTRYAEIPRMIIEYIAITSDIADKHHLAMLFPIFL